MLNLLSEPNDSKFVARKCDIVKDQSNANYNIGNEIIYNTEILKSNLCDYNDAYILVRGVIVTAAQNIQTQVAFKNFAWFTKCIIKLDGTTIDDAGDLDLVMPMYNPIEYSSNYSETTRSLWFYSKDDVTNFNEDIANNFKSSEYKAKLLENTVADGPNGIVRNATIAVLLKYLNNFWKSLEMLLINCKIELNLKWIKYCVLSAADADNNHGNSNIIFIIKDTKLCVHVL